MKRSPTSSSCTYLAFGWNPSVTDIRPFFKVARMQCSLISQSPRINGSPNQVSTTTADNQAISRLYSILQSFAQSSQAGEDLGEWKQTRDAIKRPLPQVRQLMETALNNHTNALKRPNPRAIVSGLADTWLEWVYGWKPLANSLADAFVGIQNRDNFVHYYPFQASGNADSNGITLEEQQTNSNTGVNVRGYSRDNAKVRYQGIWESRVDIPKKKVNDILGLNTQNIIPTIWNLIPYSFLIDYFTNVGDFMNITAVPWSGVRWCCKTVRTECLTSLSTSMIPVTVLPGTFAKILAATSTPGSLEVRDTRFTRTSVTSLPIPKFEVNFSISNGRAMNVVALLASRLGPLKTLTQKVTSKYPGLEKEANAFLKLTRENRDPYQLHRGKR